MFPHVLMKDANVFTVSYLSHLFLIENAYTYRVIHLRPGVYPCSERRRGRSRVWRVGKPHSVTRMLFRRQSFILVRWKYKSNKPHFHSAEFCHCNNAQVVVTCCKQYVLFYEDSKSVCMCHLSPFTIIFMYLILNYYRCALSLWIHFFLPFNVDLKVILSEKEKCSL